jgi:hypothetical protein
MSSTFSAGSAASPLALSEPGCEPSRSARSIRSAGASSPSTGLASPSSKTLLNLEAPTLDQLTLFAEAFPAKTSASLAKARGLRASAAASGGITPVLLANYDPPTSSWKTSQLCLVEGLETFSGTWPRSGTMRNGTAFQLPPLVPLTDETASGLWPTPTVGGGGQSLPEGTTPTGMTPDGRKQTVCLERYVQQTVRGLWPTPTRSMHKGSSAGAMTRLSGASRLNDRLDYAVEQGNIKTGRLNPQWVAWLMGFPIEWASFPPLETRSSRKSRKSSGEQS